MTDVSNMAEEKAPSLVNLVSSAAKAVAQVRKAIVELTDKRNALDEGLRTAQRRIAVLYALPVTRDDALQCMLDHIDNVGAGFPARTRWAHLFSKFAFPQRGYSPENSMRGPGHRRRPLCLKDVEDASAPGSAQTVFSLGDETLYTGRITQWLPFEVDALYFFFGEHLKEKIKLHFDELFPDYTDSRWQPDHRLAEKDRAGYIDATPEDLQSTVTERRGQIALLQVRLDDIERQIADTDTQINELRSSLDVGDK